MQQSAALALSGCDDSDQVEAAFEAGEAWFPQMASIKSLRALRSSSASQPVEQENESGVDQLVDQVDVRIVEAGEQNLTECPTYETARLLPLRSFHGTSTDMLLAASLSSLRRSQRYTLQVEYQAPTVPEQFHDRFVNLEVDATVLRACT